MKAFFCLLSSKNKREIMKDSFVAASSNFSIVFTMSEPQRIDLFLSTYFTLYSRTFFKKLVDHNLIQINGKIITKSSILVKENDSINVQFPPENTTISKDVDPNLPVSLVFEHEHFLVVNKPPYLSVHAPSSNHEEVTLVDWLLSKFKEIRVVGCYDRPGIIHRLDKNTSGLLIVSRNNYAHEQLSNLFKNRLIKKTYLAVVKGHPLPAGSIAFPISRDPLYRIKMSHRFSSGRPSLTNYKVVTYFKDTALLQLHPVTGRTHQIRVHCAALGHPLVGDALYGTSSKLIDRHALHALSLEFTFEGEQFSFHQEPPADFKQLIDVLGT